MKRLAAIAALGIGVVSACEPVAPPPPPPAPAAPGAVPGTDCPLFPADNVWHADVRTLPVHARSAAWLASMSSSTRNLHPDFGGSDDPAHPYGIPFQVVGGEVAKVPVTFDYDDESDPGPYPINGATPIEAGGDAHAIVVDKATCRLYETFATSVSLGGVSAGSGAIWDLRANGLRPAGWTSADAAGLPILPGLLRLDEVRAGKVDHAIRVTASRTDRTYVWPARHQAGSRADGALPPMGARFRLRAGVDLSGFSADTRVVLTAMQVHGLVLADNGSNWFFQGAATNDWPDQLISELKRVPASWFEAVDTSSLVIDANSAAFRHA